ncbi:MAG TPA: site-specific DNA-methyltransferase [Bryobacteraceae bacterium]|nr:site-specific DNA-methyltransferase [Bryobacteraceae bacterium]
MAKPWVYLAEGECLGMMPEIPSGSVDMVLCDLPYGITACSWDSKIDAAPLWGEYSRVVKEHGAIALFAQQPFATELASAAPRKLLRYDLVWDKGGVTGFGNARRMPLRRHENVLIFYRKLPVYNPQGLRACHTRCRARTRPSEVYGAGMAGESVQRMTGYPQSIMQFRRERGAAPCQKPVDLLEYLIRTYTNEGETVLDNTMGTGSTGVAAVKSGRNFIGIEMDHGRFELALTRVTRAMRKHGACRARTSFGGK